MGLKETMLDQLKSSYTNRTYDMRVESYDMSEEAAAEIIEAGWVSAILDEADYAIELARQNNCDLVGLQISNIVLSDGTVFPGEDNVLEDTCEHPDAHSSIVPLNGFRNLLYVIDRGEYKNYFVEDFAPALAIAAEILQDEGYTITTDSPVQASMGQKILLRLLGSKGNTEIYANSVQVQNNSVFGGVRENYFVQIIIRL